jgi:hypothetical protein
MGCLNMLVVLGWVYGSTVNTSHPRIPSQSGNSLQRRRSTSCKSGARLDHYAVALHVVVGDFTDVVIHGLRCVGHGSIPILRVQSRTWTARAFLTCNGHMCVICQKFSSRTIAGFWKGGFVKWVLARDEVFLRWG